MTANEPYLSPEHLAMLRDGSSISDEKIKARGYRTITEAKELMQLGFTRSQCRVPGLLLPLWATDGQNSLYVYRPDNPRVIEQKRKGKLPDGTYPCKVRWVREQRSSSISHTSEIKPNPEIKDVVYTPSR